MRQLMTQIWRLAHLISLTLTNRPSEDLALAGYVGPPKSGQKDAASEF